MKGRREKGEGEGWRRGTRERGQDGRSAELGSMEVLVVCDDRSDLAGFVYVLQFEKYGMLVLLVLNLFTRVFRSSWISCGI